MKRSSWDLGSELPTDQEYIPLPVQILNLIIFIKFVPNVSVELLLDR
jgi:hypothetical protein